MPVLIPIHATKRGVHDVVYYRTRLQIRAGAIGGWHTVSCVIDTARDFTLVPKSILPPWMTILALPRAQQTAGQAGDYLGSLFYRFPDNLWRPPPVTNLEFHCAECQVTTRQGPAVHLALRDILANFNIAVSAAHEMLLTPRRIHAGFPTNP